MTLSELQTLLADWYEIDRDDLALPHTEALGELHPVLAEFYARLGGLAERDTPLRHPASHHYPLATQDTIVPVSELRVEDDVTVFAHENQGNFAIGAHIDSNEALAKGDYLERSSYAFEPVGVPLEELLVTLVLRETIWSVDDRYAIHADDAVRRAWGAWERTGAVQHYEGRYLWTDTPFRFLLTRDEWYSDTVGIASVAFRGAWREPPSERRVRIPQTRRL